MLFFLLLLEHTKYNAELFKTKGKRSKQNIYIFLLITWTNNYVEANLHNFEKVIDSLEIVFIM